MREAPELDGVPGEWDAEFRDLSAVVRGAPASPQDLTARVALAYDATNLYVAAEVTDDRLVVGGDWLELILGVPGGTVERVRFDPGDSSHVRGVARTAGGAVIEGARVVLASTATGWSVEASVPWARIPKSDRVRVGYRAALALHDADASNAVESVMATSEALAYDALPPLSMEAELSLGAGLLRERGLTMPPRLNILADVAGDSRFERVLVYDRYLVVLGPGFRSGIEYFYRDLGGSEHLRIEVSDSTGDRKDDIAYRRLTPEGELAVLLSFQDGGDVPTVVSSTLVPSAGPVAAAPHAGSGAERTHVPPTLAPLVPRGVIDVHQTASGTVVFAAKPAGTDSDAVYTLYKQRRAVDGPPRFDVSADFSEDARPERLVVHGADLVVFGPGFRGGRSFAALTLEVDAAELESVTARDVDGDGKMDVVASWRTSGRTWSVTYRIRGGQFERVDSSTPPP